MEGFLRMEKRWRMDCMVTTGEKKSGGTYRDGKKEGPWTEWYKSGQKKVEEITRMV
jgi:antitoxin component YwqK of YwqJK toxin-antitoxin module